MRIPFRPRALALAVGVALAASLACSALIPEPRPSSPPSPCAQEVYGACVVYDKGVERIPAARLESMFRAAAVHWNTEPGAIAGYTVVVKGRDPYDLGGNLIWGVTLLDVRRLDFAVPAPPCPELVFVHEWGHAGAGVLGHEDPRFEDAAIRANLAAMEVPGCRA